MRSLEALIGRYSRISLTMHLHSTQPKTVQLDDDSDDDILEVQEMRGHKRPVQVQDAPAIMKRPAAESEIIDLVDDSDDDDVEIVEPSAGPKRARAT